MIMKPIKDIFSSHIQGLYKGHEVDAPGSVQEGVFNQLDAINGSAASGSVSGGFTSKAVLGAAVVIVGFAWYLMPVSEDQVVVDEVEVVEELVVEEVEVLEEIAVIEALNEVEVAPEVVEVSVEAPILAEEEIQKTVVTAVVEDVKPEVVVDSNVEDEIIIEEPAPTEEAVKIKEAQEPEEVLEWVLPAKLEVDE
jgi:hypothetical protein